MKIESIMVEESDTWRVGAFPQTPSADSFPVPQRAFGPRAKLTFGKWCHWMGRSLAFPVPTLNIIQPRAPMVTTLRPDGGAMKNLETLQNHFGGRYLYPQIFGNHMIISEAISPSI
jgi:hypothetical protein